MKAQHVLLVLLLALTACMPAETPATPTAELPTIAPATVTPEPPTATITPPTDTPVPPTDTPQPTVTVEPQVWEIWFRGFSCERLALCELGPGQELYYYSIQSDGTGLKQLDVTDFPPAPTVPDNAPPVVIKIGMVSPPKISPDGKSMLYFGQDLKLYLLDPVNIQWKVLFDSGPYQALVGPFCWALDGTQIRFAEIWRGSEFRAPIVYQIDTNGQNLQQLFTLPGLEGTQFGDCSPNGREMVLQANNTRQKEASGLYIVDLQNGEQHQILQNYYISMPRARLKP